MTHPATTATSPPTNTPATSTQGVALIVAAAFFMMLLDGAILNTSLPLMAQGLGVTPLALTAGVTVYLLAAAAIMPTSGWLADRWEARRVFFLAMATFTLASLACGMAQSLGQLVAARALQGMAAGLMAPVGRTLVLRRAGKSEVMAAIATIVWPSLLAPVLGPPLGGFISTYASWRWNFFINLPVGVLGLYAVWRWIPRTPVPRPARLDWWGSVSCASALVLLLLGMERGAQAGPHLDAWGVPILLTLAGMGTGMLAVRHLRGTPHPVVSLMPLQVRSFSIATAGGGTLFMTCMQSAPFLLPLMFQLAFGMGAVEAGLLTLAYFMGNLLMKSVTTPILRRWGFRQVMTVGGTVAALTLFGCASLQGGTPLWLIVALLVFAGAMRSMQMTSLNTLAFADIEPAQRGAASTLSSMFAQLAAAMGAATGALLLALSQMAQGRSALTAMDFRVAFIVMAMLALCAVALFRRLEPDDGAEVSGHRAPSRI
jgi:EmrB/QacA subfamily drug resistance transporter